MRTCRLRLLPRPITIGDLTASGALLEVLDADGDHRYTLNPDTVRMPRAETTAQTRDRLVQAGRLAFEAKGFNAVTVEEIAADAGYTRGAFYQHFRDKAALFWEVCQRQNEKMHAELVGSLDEVAPDEASAVAQEWFDRFLTRQPLSRALAEVVTSATLSDENRKHVADLLSRQRMAISGMLTAIGGARTEEFPIPIEHFAALALAISTGISQQHEVDPKAVPASLFGLGQLLLWHGALAGATKSPSSPQSSEI